MAEPEFIVNGRHYPIPQDLTLGEMCDAETYFHVEFGEKATPGVRMAAAMLWIAIARVDQTVTVDDIRALPPEVFAKATEDDARPPDSDAKPNASAETSGDGSKNGGGDPAVIPEATGLPS